MLELMLELPQQIQQVGRCLDIFEPVVDEVLVRLEHMKCARIDVAQSLREHAAHQD